jgi:hypothetical protein
MWRGQVKPKAQTDAVTQLFIQLSVSIDASRALFASACHSLVITLTPGLGRLPRLSLRLTQSTYCISRHTNILYLCLLLLITTATVLVFLEPF